DQHVLRRADRHQVPSSVGGDVRHNRTMSSTVPLFLDCDPGIDDALALAYLCCQDDVDVVGIAASGGNVATQQLVENTRGSPELADRSDIPVHAGPRLPLAWQGPNSTADHDGPDYAARAHRG